MSEGAEEGLAAVYTDVAYDSTRLQVEGVVPSSSFGLFAHGQADVTAATVRAVGGCAALGETMLGTANTWVRVASVQMRGRQAGRATMETEYSAGPYGIAILNRFGDLDASQIEFGTASVEIRAVRHGPAAVEPFTSQDLLEP
jgi:hypothetical protein